MADTSTQTKTTSPVVTQKPSSTTWVEIGSVTALIVGLLSLDAYGFLTPLDVIMIYDYTLPQFIFFSLIIFGIAIVALNMILRIIESIESKNLSLSDLKSASTQFKKESAEFLQGFSQLNDKEAGRFVNDQVKQFGSKSKALFKKNTDKKIKNKDAKAKAKASKPTAPKLSRFKKAAAKKVNVVIPDNIIAPDTIKSEFFSIISPGIKNVFAITENESTIRSVTLQENS